MCRLPVTFSCSNILVYCNCVARRPVAHPSQAIYFSLALEAWHGKLAATSFFFSICVLTRTGDLPTGTTMFQSQPAYWVQSPGSLGKATLAVTITLGLGSILTVAARLYIRCLTRTMKIDDYLMAIACVSAHLSLGRVDIGLIILSPL